MLPNECRSLGKCPLFLQIRRVCENSYDTAGSKSQYVSDFLSQAEKCIYSSISEANYVASAIEVNVHFFPSKSSG